MNMKWIGLMAGTALMVVAANGENKSDMKSQKEKLSYTLGHQIGSDMKRNNIDIDPTIIAKGLADAFSGSSSALTQQEMGEAMTVFQNEMRMKQEEMQAKQAQLGAENKKAGEAFLAENKKVKGVKVLPSGVQYIEIKAGKGKSPTANSTVTTHYRGTTINGKEFDSSYNRGQPSTFPINGVIQGWREILPLMKEGSKWKVFVPSELAYGPQSPSPEIGANSTLIFEIELLAIK